jgi:hypothetical protein
VAKKGIIKPFVEKQMEKYPGLAATELLPIVQKRFPNMTSGNLHSVMSTVRKSKAKSAKPAKTAKPDVSDEPQSEVEKLRQEIAELVCYIMEQGLSFAMKYSKGK